MGKWIDKAKASGQIKFVEESPKLLGNVNDLFSEVETELVFDNNDTTKKFQSSFYLMPKVGEIIHITVPDSGEVKNFKIKNVVHECNEDGVFVVVKRIVFEVEELPK